VSVFSSMSRSAPAMKLSLPEVRMTPFTFSSAVAFCAASAKAAIEPSFSTFMERPGMSHRMVAMPSLSTE
jgi:hypothetical protein